MLACRHGTMTIREDLRHGCETFVKCVARAAPDPHRRAMTFIRSASVRVTAAYALVLLAVYLIHAALGPHAHEVAVNRMSTNVHNLGRGHVGTLIGSAFVNDGGDLFFWLPGPVCLLALGELMWCSRGLLVTFAVGHLGATLIVAVGLVAAIETGMLPASVARASDVGISYGAVCVLGALTAAIPARWRGIWVGWWLGTAVVAAAGADFTAVGHVVALLLGIALSFRLRAVGSLAPAHHQALLMVGVTFGYLLLAGPSLLAPAGGLAGAFIGLAANRSSVRGPGECVDVVAAGSPGRCARGGRQGDRQLRLARGDRRRQQVGVVQPAVKGVGARL